MRGMCFNAVTARRSLPYAIEPMPMMSQAMAAPRTTSSAPSGNSPALTLSSPGGERVVVGKDSEVSCVAEECFIDGENLSLSLSELVITHKSCCWTLVPYGLH